MAQAPEITLRVESSLFAVRAEADYLPNVVAEWHTLTDANQASIQLDWDHLLIDYLGELADYDRSGTLTTDQQARYHTLLEQLMASEPLFGQLNIPLSAHLRLALHPS